MTTRYGRPGDRAAHRRILRLVAEAIFWGCLLTGALIAMLEIKVPG